MLNSNQYELTSLENKVTAVQMQSLSDEERKIVYQLADKINIEDRNSITNYGTEVLTQIANTSTSVLNRTKNNQLSKDIAETLKSTMMSMKKVSDQENQNQTGLVGFFNKWKNKASNKMLELQIDVQDVNQSLNVMEGKLRVYIDDLDRDAKVLEDLKNKNKEYYNDLSLYIAASELKLVEYEEVILPQLKREAEESRDMLKIQEYNELSSRKTQLERHVHNLKNARQMTLQQIPQIIALQDADYDQKQQLQDHILLSVPLWRNQLGLTSMLSVQAEIAGVSKLSSDFTNQLMQQNAKLLRTTIADVAEQNERGIIDAESFKVVTDELEGMILDVMKAQDEGRRRRKDAEVMFTENENRIYKAIMDASNKTLALGSSQSTVIDGDFKRLN